MTVSISNLNFTWANSSNVFTAIGANVNASSYAANSRILRLGVNNSEVFSVDTDGILYIKKVPFTGNGNITIQGGDPTSAFNHANLAFDKANSANLLAFNTGIGANAYAIRYAMIYANGVANSANSHSNSNFNTLMTNYLDSLPTTLPASSGQYWWNGNVLSKS